MTIDLDELERQVAAYAWENLGRAEMLELVALARKGQANITVEQYEATWKDFTEAEKRAEAYERALRFYADPKLYEQVEPHDGMGTCCTTDRGAKAREALEKGGHRR